VENGVILKDNLEE
jgi:hypothetical protein